MLDYQVTTWGAHVQGRLAHAPPRIDIPESRTRRRAAGAGRRARLIAPNAQALLKRFAPRPLGPGRVVGIKMRGGG